MSCTAYKTHIYTNNPPHGCNGWTSIDIETCKQHCLLNAIPDGCRPIIVQSVCRYVVWQGGTCHLSVDCQRVAAAEGESRGVNKSEKMPNTHF